MSLARQTRDQVLSIISASAPASRGGLSPADLQPEVAPYTPAAEIAARQIAMRLRHDLQRLKEIKSIDRKVAAKRKMLPAYFPWLDGLIAAGRDVPAGFASGAPVAPGADEVLPVALVWAIDIADWPRALAYAEHVLRFDVKLPARYERDAPTLVVEEIAEVALKAQARGEAFPLDVLERVDELTAGVDMHDQPRAKLFKAIGAELVRAAGTATGDVIVPTIDRAVAALTRAQELHDRVGVKTMLKGLEKARAALPPVEPAADPATAPTADIVASSIDVDAVVAPVEPIADAIVAPVVDAATPPAAPIDVDVVATCIAADVAGSAVALHDTLTALAAANRQEES